MKTTPILMILLVAAAGLARSEDALAPEIQNPVRTPDPAVVASFPDPVPVNPSPSVPKEELPEFELKSTTTRDLDVIKPPPMSGLPPVTGTITETVQVVEDPKLPEPAEPLSSTSPQDPAVIASLRELRRSHKATHLVFVSAMVYDHSRTLLNCYPNGGLDRKVTAWSNLDFTRFCGVSNFQVKNKDGVTTKYGLFMGLSTEDTKRRAEMMAKHGRPYRAPVIPELPDLALSGPAFLVIGGDPADKEMMDLVEGMHALYRTEGVRMEDAYQARIKAHEDLKEYLLANPPKPKDVTIQVWKRDAPTGNSEEGGAR